MASAPAKVVGEDHEHVRRRGHDEKVDENVGAVKLQIPNLLLTCCVLFVRDGMDGWDGVGWGGMGWDGMGWDGMGWDGISVCARPPAPHGTLSGTSAGVRVPSSSPQAP